MLGARPGTVNADLAECQMSDGYAPARDSGRAVPPAASGRHHGTVDEGGIVRRHAFEELDLLAGRQRRDYRACPSCGTKVRHKSYSLRCRSCGTSLLAGADFAGRVPPDGVLPFQVDRDEAKRAFARWLRSRRLAPGSLRGVKRLDEIEGVFLPYWSFSAQTSTTYSGQRGVGRFRSDVRTTTDAQGNRRQHSSTVSYTEWQRAKGQIDRYFDAILVPGCSIVADKLPPWPTGAVLPYSVPSVAGHGVVPYDIEPEDGFAQAKTRMGQDLDRDIRADIGGAQQRIHSYSTTHHRPGFTLLLLPAWMVTYSHRGVTRTALVNGHSGATVGDRPYSSAKLVVPALVAVAAVAVGLFFLLRH